MTTELETRQWLLELLLNDFEVAGIGIEDVPDECDLLLEGIVDSLRFAEVIAELEARLNVALDLTEMNPLDVTRIGPLARHLASVGCHEGVNSATELAQPEDEGGQTSVDSPRESHSRG